MEDFKEKRRLERADRPESLYALLTKNNKCDDVMRQRKRGFGLGGKLWESD